jgi:sugar phosphate isomerase/epimerase
VNLDAEQKYDPKLKDAIALLKGRETMLWLNVNGRKYARASEEGDGIAVEVLREIADMAHESGLKVALYPHTGFYVESVDDSIRLVEKINRRNVGATFNLCHWLKVEGDKDYRPTLKRAADCLFQVSINGADAGDTKSMGWDRLIQPLGSGSYDVESLLVAIKDIGYAGPIGLQGYAVKGDSKENLTRSIQAWRKMVARLKGK